MDLTAHPVYAQWNTRNNVNPSKISSKQKVWWQCHKGHEWETTVASRVYNKTNCPYCSNLKIAPGFNDFVTTHPAIAAQWDYTKNVTINPEHIFSTANEKVWWVCSKGHEWEATVRGRTKNPEGNCLKCLQDPKDVKSSLLNQHPELAQYWDPENTIQPETLKPDSDKNIFWVCESGHKWSNSPHNILRRKIFCPDCSVNDKTTSIKEQLDALNIKILNEKPHLLKKKSNKKYFWECGKRHKWEASFRSVTRNKISCPECAEKVFVSEAEKSINSWIETSLGLTTLANSRTVLKNLQELDIYIPEKKIAIEFNGLYWHDENHKTKNYHYDKWLACKNQGIQLIQVWEDDWKRNPGLVKRMLAHKLSATAQKKVYARNTTIVTVPVKESAVFLNENHIQGAITGGIHIGLQHDGAFVAVMVLKKEKEGLSLLRYATSQIVVGGFSKLIGYLEKTHQPESIVTFSDNTVSDGNLYESNGFVATKVLPPDYMYIVQRERKHKFGYRLKRFRNDPNLDYIEGLSEKQLAELNGIPRIWDAGKIKWEKVRIN